MDIKKQIGLKLKHRRKEKNLSQTEIADQIGMQRKAIAEIESGKSNFMFDTLTRIAEALDCSVEIDLKVKK